MYQFFTTASQAYSHIDIGGKVQGVEGISITNAAHLAPLEDHCFEDVVEKLNQAFEEMGK